MFGFAKDENAGIAQLVEHDLAKVGVASPSLVSRSIRMPRWWNGRHVGLKIQWSLRPCGFKSRPGYDYRLKPAEFQRVFLFEAIKCGRNRPFPNSFGEFLFYENRLMN